MRALLVLFVVFGFALASDAHAGPVVKAAKGAACIAKAPVKVAAKAVALPVKAAANVAKVPVRVAAKAAKVPVKAAGKAAKLPKGVLRFLFR